MMFTLQKSDVDLTPGLLSSVLYTVVLMRRCGGVFFRGNKYRATGATNMNDASSRSHAILTFKVKDSGEVRIVDLAGSERIKRSGAEGGRLQVTWQYMGVGQAIQGRLVD